MKAEKSNKKKLHVIEKHELNVHVKQIKRRRRFLDVGNTIINKKKQKMRIGITQFNPDKFIYFSENRAFIDPYQSCS
jgi:hypothetical protein